MSEVKCNCPWNPDSHAEDCPVYMRDRIDALATELQARRIQVDTLTELYANALNELGACAAALPGISYMDLPDGGSPTVAEQVARMAAELAALKGGRDELQAQKELMEQALSDLWSVRIDKIKSHCMDAAPPAQASAWVPVSERLPDGWSVRECCDMEADIYGLIVSSPRVDGVSASNSVWPTDTDPAHLLLWHLLAAAPTPGASDGKGGDHE